MWSDILNSNRKALASPLRAFGRSLAQLAGAIEDGDIEAQEAFLARAQAALAGMTRDASGPQADAGSREDVRSGDDNPEIQADPDSADPRSVENDL